MRNTKTKEVILSGLFIALGILIPVIFHTLGGAGPMFLPMHIPVMVAGFILSPATAFLVGAITPFISSVLTGMPILMPIGIIMMIELGLYGLVVSLMSQIKVNPVVSLICAMISGRIGAGIMVSLLVNTFGIKLASPIIYLKGSLITGIPGVIIQIIFIPTLLMIIKKYNSSILKQ